MYILDRLRNRDSMKAAEKGFWASLNLRTALLRKLTKAGISPWPKLWHTLRASAETDLATRFPLHTVTAWLGNTPTVAQKHYLMVTDADFDKAASVATQIPTQLALECVGIGGHGRPENEKTPGFSGVFSSKVERRGVEPPTFALRTRRSPN